MLWNNYISIYDFRVVNRIFEILSNTKLTLPYLNSARVWLEPACRVLCGHSALYGRTVQLDVVLHQAHGGQGLAVCHPDLALH